MADIDEVSVRAPAHSVRGVPVSRAEEKAPSPVGTGLLYGAAAASVFGPIGTLVGAGAGILARRLQKNQLEREQAYHSRLRTEQLDLQDHIDSEREIADPDELRAIAYGERMAKKGYEMLYAGDETGAAYVDQGNAIIAGNITADREARAQKQAAQQGVQRDLVSGATRALRDEYQQKIAFVEEAHSRSERIFELTSQPGFNPNDPKNKALLADMMTFGVNGMYKDAPSVWNALAQGSGALGTAVGAVAGGVPGAVVGNIAGEGAGAIATYMTSKDFVATVEDYNRFAMNLQSTADKVGNESMQRIAKQASHYEGYAKQAGILPEDESVQSYVTGGADEIRFVPNVGKVKPIPRIELAPSTRDAPNDRRGLIDRTAPRGTRRSRRDYRTRVLQEGQWVPLPTN